MKKSTTELPRPHTGGTDLLPHNQTAFERAMQRLETEDGTCIVQPTGTGKTYVGAAVIKAMTEKVTAAGETPRILVLTPTDAIMKEYKKHKLPHVEYKTYAWLIRRTLKEMKEKYGKYDLIVADEFHHLGAEVWGKAFENLRKVNNAKIFGTTATHQRYLEGGRDMAMELFGTDGIANELKLEDAWAQGILIAPKYILGVSNAMLEELNEKVNKAKSIKGGDTESRNKLIKEAEKTIANSKSRQLTALIGKHLHRDAKRLVVFCQNIDDIENKKAVVMEALRDNGFKMKDYEIHSKTSAKEASKTLDEFAAEDYDEIFEDGVGVKVIFSVNKLNEGVHVPNVDGEIMFNTTMSPTKMLQQWGRCYNTNQTVNRRPLIFDMTCNIGRYEGWRRGSIIPGIAKGPKRQYPPLGEPGREREPIDTFPSIEHDIDTSKLPILEDNLVDIVGLFSNFDDSINNTTVENARRQEVIKAKEKVAVSNAEIVKEYVLKYDGRLPKENLSGNRYSKAYTSLKKSKIPKAAELLEEIHTLANAMAVGKKYAYITLGQCHGFNGKVFKKDDMLCFSCMVDGQNGYIQYDKEFDSYSIFRTDSGNADSLVCSIKNDTLTMDGQEYAVVGLGKRTTFLNAQSYISNILKKEHPDIERFNISFDSDNLVNISWQDKDGKHGLQLMSFHDGLILEKTNPVKVYLTSSKSIQTINAPFEEIAACDNYVKYELFKTRYMESEVTSVRPSAETRAWERFLTSPYPSRNNFLKEIHNVNGNYFVSDNKGVMYELRMIGKDFLHIMPQDITDKGAGYVYCDTSKVTSTGREIQLINKALTASRLYLENHVDEIIQEGKPNVGLAMVRNPNISEATLLKISKAAHPVLRTEATVARLRKKYDISEINAQNRYQVLQFEAYNTYACKPGRPRVYKLIYDEDNHTFCCVNKLTGNITYLDSRIKLIDGKYHTILQFYEDKNKAMLLAEYDKYGKPQFRRFDGLDKNPGIKKLR